MKAEMKQDLFETLKTRFEKNMQRHKNLIWDDFEAKLIKNESKINSLYEMEKTGGEPDVVGYDEKTNEFIVFDCSPETPEGRRSTCYDLEALNSRKANKPETNAIDMANKIGIDLLTKEEYFKLQELGEFDLKTSSWIKTPEKIRKLGGALFCDRRYDTVFLYHNGAQSYYSVRGFRGVLRV